MSHTSSTSSLLQQNRPSSLQPQPHSPDAEQTLAERVHLETHESRHLTEPFVVAPKTRSRANSNTNSHSQSDLLSLKSSSSSSIPHLAAIASSSSGLNYLNQDPTMSMSSDIAHPELDCLVNEPCCERLEAARDGSIGRAIPRDQWQPDCSSALCSFPFCTAIFAPSTSYFAFGPRRHHCRKCGLLFCSSHSNNRAPLYDENHHLAKQRVCDVCIHKDSEVITSRPTSRRPSISSLDCQTDSSISAEYITTPSDLSLSRSSTRVSRPSTPTIPGGSLAPVQQWMDKEGVLSLYPLALPSVHRRLAVPAARPLFCPSQAAIRVAKEKQNLAVQSCRQRRVRKEREDSQLQQSRRGSMESVEEEDGQMGSLAFGKRSASQERIVQSTF